MKVKINVDKMLEHLQKKGYDVLKKHNISRQRYAMWLDKAYHGKKFALKTALKIADILEVKITDIIEKE